MELNVEHIRNMYDRFQSSFVVTGVYNFVNAVFAPCFPIMSRNRNMRLVHDHQYDHDHQLYQTFQSPSTCNYDSETKDCMLRDNKQCDNNNNRYQREVIDVWSIDDNDDKITTNQNNINNKTKQTVCITTLTQQQYLSSIIDNKDYGDNVIFMSDNELMELEPELIQNKKIVVISSNNVDDDTIANTIANVNDTNIDIAINDNPVYDDSNDIDNTNDIGYDSWDNNCSYVSQSYTSSDNDSNDNDDEYVKDFE